MYTRMGNLVSEILTRANSLRLLNKPPPQNKINDSGLPTLLKILHIDYQKRYCLTERSFLSEFRLFVEL